MKSIGLDDVDFVSCLSAFDNFGVWRLDIGSGLIHASRDFMVIHGIEPRDGPLSIPEALACYDEQDRELVLSLIEDAIAKKAAFRFVMQAGQNRSGPRLIRGTGRYRINSHGKAEVYGTCSEFLDRVRTLAIEE